jgi:hypothetical protein
VEYKHSLLSCITTGRWSGFIYTAEEKLFHTGGSIYIDGTWDVPSGVLVVETAINDMIFGDLTVVCAIYELIKLQQEVK